VFKEGGLLSGKALPSAMMSSKLATGLEPQKIQILGLEPQNIDHQTILC
jgi:hypothetical protein